MNPKSSWQKFRSLSFLSILLLFLFSCELTQENKQINNHSIPGDVLDFSGTPSSPNDRSTLAFSDQGAWFAYGLPTDKEYYGGFSGPFLMTQENGVWSSPALSNLHLKDVSANQILNWSNFKITQSSDISHLSQTLESEKLEVSQELFFTSPFTALISTRIENLSEEAISIQAYWEGQIFLESLHLHKNKKLITITSEKSDAVGYLQVLGEQNFTNQVTDSSYTFQLETFQLKPGNARTLFLAQSFTFPEYDFQTEQEDIEKLSTKHFIALSDKLIEKSYPIEKLISKLDTIWSYEEYKILLVKAALTLQNNWRIPAGELKHSGLFPSYHYIWFHGFWAWDSWKHAVALAHYDIELAKEQIKAMYDFQTPDGFIADCIYRDTTIENHNWRNTKPPLSAWAVWEVYKQEKGLQFIEELYPKLIKQHKWWYLNRDHDRDGICEYGSTDGTLIAAKWESGMDNAVRFDDSKILKNSESAYSLDQESVDLNAYLYAEKIFLNKIATALNKPKEADSFKTDAEVLKAKIQEQFFEKETGWFFDTSIDGKSFIKIKGCEGWIPLWANVATPEQAEAVKNNMMDPEQFFTKVPFQTLSASHPEFKPDGGYWRGPNWLDQAYFGVKGLKNYGYYAEANEASKRLFHNAEGVLEKGKSIRENYNPITGEGLESENFSWSAAHYLLLLIDE